MADESASGSCEKTKSDSAHPLRYGVQYRILKWRPRDPDLKRMLAAERAPGESGSAEDECRRRAQECGSAEEKSSRRAQECGSAE